jgi:hypothetical protein
MTYSLTFSVVVTVAVTVIVTRSGPGMGMMVMRLPDPDVGATPAGADVTGACIAGDDGVAEGVT